MNAPIPYPRRGWSILVGAVVSLVLAAAGLSSVAAQTSPATPAATPAGGVPVGTPDLELTDARVRSLADLGILVFEQQVAGEAGGTVPEARGAMDGAPVLAYVFPTTLPPGAVGFRESDGTLALVVTSHPDFDDTPLWDESQDGLYDNDGRVYHTHWVVLVPDARVPGGLAVREVRAADTAAVLPPTNPGMPLALDSPGFSVGLDRHTLRVVVPVDRVSGETAFNFDAVTAYLEVNISDPGRPVLGVYAVYSVLSGDLSLPFTVTEG